MASLTEAVALAGECARTAWAKRNPRFQGVMSTAGHRQGFADAIRFVVTLHPELTHGLLKEET